MTRPLQVGILSLISLVCILGHLFCPPSWAFVHEFLFKLTYIPIVLGAIWLGRWFALQLTTLFCLVYLFHIFIQLYHHSHHSIYSALLDLALYYIFAWVTGYLSDAERAQARSLSEAYAALKEKTSLLVRFEDSFRRVDRLKSMGELAGTVAHEVRTPLSALQGSIEIIVSENADRDTREKFSRKVYQEIRRINEVVNNFLELGREKSPDLTPVALKELVENCATLWGPMLKKENIQLEVEIPESLKVMVDSSSMKQVITNLVMNSVNAMEGSKGKIALSAQRKEEDVILSIEDNGCGVSESVRDHLFDAFATSRKEGSGLGLFLSRNILRTFGGELELRHSEPGCTIFEMRLHGES